MVSKHFIKKTRAKNFAVKRREMGFKSSVFKLRGKKGFGVSTTRKK